LSGYFLSAGLAIAALLRIDARVTSHEPGYRPTLSTEWPGGLAAARLLGNNGRKPHQPLESSAILGAVIIVARLIFSVPLCRLT
jgi:hypothetical protein